MTKSTVRRLFVSGTPLSPPGQRPILASTFVGAVLVRSQLSVAGRQRVCVVLRRRDSQFSLPPIDSCDGSFRVVSPGPIATFRHGATSVEVYPGRLVTARIGVADFTRVTRRRAHTAVGEWRTRIGRAMPRSGMERSVRRGRIRCRATSRVAGCSRAAGMGFTHPLAAGSYVFSSTVTAMDGSVRREAVRFRVE